MLHWVETLAGVAVFVLVVALSTPQKGEKVYRTEVRTPNSIDQNKVKPSHDE